MVFLVISHCKLVKVPMKRSDKIWVEAIKVKKEDLVAWAEMGKKDTWVSRHLLWTWVYILLIFEINENELKISTNMDRSALV